MKRYLNLNTQFTDSNLKNIFREAYKQELIQNLDKWFDYLEARNLTSHTYNEETAEETYKQAKRFAEDCALLVQSLKKNIEA